jgi:hypothetical protein
VIRHAVPAVHKGNMQKRPDIESTARRILESKTASVTTEVQSEFNMGIDD